MRRLWRVILLVTFLCCPSTADALLTIDVTPRALLIPAQVLIKVRITPSDENRMVCLNWGLEGFMGNRSCQTLEGQAAPRTFTYWRWVREAGVIVFQGEVVTADGKSHTVSTHVDATGEF